MSKVYTWRELLVNNILVSCPEKWMREQLVDFAINTVGDGLWNHYMNTIHDYGDKSVAYFVKSSSQGASLGVEMMITNGLEREGSQTIPYEKFECYDIYNGNIDLNEFEKMMLGE